MEKKYSDVEIKTKKVYLEQHKNFLKEAACIAEGYKFEFWIFDDKKILEIKTSNRL